jgi:hypothetical protein
MPSLRLSGRTASMTFLQSVSAAGDYMLNKAIGEVDAGACVSVVHQFCGCKINACGPRREKYLYSCFGGCFSPYAGHCC